MERCLHLPGDDESLAEDSNLRLPSRSPTSNCPHSPPWLSGSRAPRWGWGCNKDLSLGAVKSEFDRVCLIQSLMTGGRPKQGPRPETPSRSAAPDSLWCPLYRRGDCGSRQALSRGSCGTTGAASCPTRGKWAWTDARGCDLALALLDLPCRALQTAFEVLGVGQAGGGVGRCDLKTSPCEGPIPCLALLAPSRLRCRVLSLCGRSDELSEDWRDSSASGCFFKKMPFSL